MRLFGWVHAGLLLAIVLAAALLAFRSRRQRLPWSRVRLVLGYGLAANELIWWIFRYSHEGIHLTNLPLQLCDVTLWVTILACLTAAPLAIEFAYFAGMAGSFQRGGRRQLYVSVPEAAEPVPTRLAGPVADLSRRCGRGGVRSVLAAVASAPSACAY